MYVQSLEASVEAPSTLHSPLDVGSYVVQNLNLHPFALLGPLHTRDCKPVTITLQALSLVGNAEPVQVRFTLHLRDQRST